MVVWSLMRILMPHLLRRKCTIDGTERWYFNSGIRIKHFAEKHLLFTHHLEGTRYTGGSFSSPRSMLLASLASTGYTIRHGGCFMMEGRR